MGAQIAAAAIPAIIGALTAGKGTNQRDITPKFQTDLINQLLSGIKGEGPLASLFGTDINAFQTSVSDPLQNIFQKQIAPGIQQASIASGQQRGTPLESQLARAGVDVQGGINQLFLPFQQQGQQNMQDVIGKILGFSPQTQTSPDALGGALRGLGQSGALPNLIQQIFGGGGGGTDFGGGISRSGNAPQSNFGGDITRKGFS